MIRITCLIFFFSLSTGLMASMDFAGGAPSENVQLLLKQQRIVEEVKREVGEEEFQNLYESGELKEVIASKIKAGSIQVNDNKNNLETSLSLFLKNNPFKGREPAEVERLIDTQMKGSKAEVLFKRFPRMKKFMGVWLTDEQAIPALAELPQKKRKIRNVFIFILGFMVIFFIFSGKLLEGEPRLLIRFLKKTVLKMIMVWMCFGFFFMNFKKELSPTWKIVKQELIFP